MDPREPSGSAVSPIAASIVYTLKLASIVFVLFWLAYVAAANAVLAYGIERLVDRPGVHIRYRAAHSFWPGDVVLEDFSIAQQVETVEWSLRARHARVRLDVGELLGRVLHVRHFDADGFSYRLRLRLTRDEADQRATAALPPIAPFDDPPLLTGPVTSREGPDWRYFIDDSDVDVEELWIHHVRFVGHARSRGGFSTMPTSFICVGPASLDVIDGEVTIGPYRAAHAVSGHLDFLLEPTNPTNVSALRVFRGVTGHATLDGEVDTIAPLELFFDRLRIDDGSGAVHLDARAQNGLLLPASVFSYASRAVAVSIDPIGLRAAGDLDVRARVEARRDHHAILVDARIPPTSVVRAGVDAEAGRVDAATLSLVVDGADLTGDDRFGGAVVDVPRARMPDARLIDPLRDGVPRPLGGEATARLHAEIDAAFKGKATVDSSVVKAKVRWGDVTIGFDGTSRLDVDAVDLVARSAKLSGDGDLVNVTVARGGKTTSAIWTRYTLDESELGFGGDAPSVDLRVEGHLSDAAPLVDLFTPSKPAAWLTHLVGVHASDYDVVMTARDRAFVLRAGAAAGTLKGEGALRFAGGESRGALLVEDGPLSIGVDFTDGHTGVEALAGRAWLAARLATLAPPAPQRPAR